MPERDGIEVGAGEDHTRDRGELADGLGNLLARTVTLLRTHPGQYLPEAATAESDASRHALAASARALGPVVDEAVDRFAPDEALRAIWRVVSETNRYLAGTAPWTLAKDASQVRAILHRAADALRAIGAALAPFLPATARAIAAALDDLTRPAPLLFPKLG